MNKCDLVFFFHCCVSRNAYELWARERKSGPASSRRIYVHAYVSACYSCFFAAATTRWAMNVRMQCSSNMIVLTFCLSREKGALLRVLQAVGITYTARYNYFNILVPSRGSNVAEVSFNQTGGWMKDRLWINCLVTELHSRLKCLTNSGNHKLSFVIFFFPLHLSPNCHLRR